MKLKCELHICLTKSVTKVTSIKSEIISQLYRKLLQKNLNNFFCYNYIVSPSPNKALFYLSIDISLYICIYLYVYISVL